MRTAELACAAAMAMSLCLTGCAGNGAGLDANGEPLVPGAGNNGPLTADFDSIQAQVFTPICTVCHIGAGAPHGLRLDAADSYHLLVGVASAEVPSVLRVKPGDPDNSYLIQKLEGHAAVGARMPFGGPYLSGDVIAVIRQWILDGAAPSSGTATPAAFSIVAVAPAAHETLAAAPPQIMIGLNQELDLTRVSQESARIERVTSIGVETVVESIPARVTVPAGNPRALLLWPLQPLREGHYRVVLSAAAATGISDIAGNALPQAAPDGMNVDAAAGLPVTTFDVEAAP